MILAPFRLIVSLLFRISHAVFHDPGWAVVGMSVLLSLLLTPLYVWIERRKNANRISEAPMQAEIDKIEAVYRGRERFFYTREIHRRYGYKPLTALIPVLGLLVQIPFLLAAYHYLAELPLFSGVPFLYIHDLSRPDTIARVAGIPVNLLAILMTLINLVSGWRYADPRKPKERIQYIAVALIFLVLLYRCASAVVLYWTLSQALSLVRSEVFFRKSNTAFSHPEQQCPVNHIPIWGVPATVVAILSLAILLVGQTFLLPKPTDIASFRDTAQLVFRFLFLILIAAVLTVIHVGKTTRFAPESLPIGFRAALLLEIAIALTMTLIRWGGLPSDGLPAIDFLGDMALPLLGLGASLILLAAWPFLMNFLRVSHPSSGNQPSTRRLSAVAALFALCIGAQLLLCAPICVYSTFPAGARNLSGETLLLSGLTETALLGVIAWGVIRFLPRAAGICATRILWIIFVVAFVYGNLIPADYGVLFNGFYSKPENLHVDADAITFETTLLIVGITALWMSFRRLVLHRSFISALVVILLSFLFRTATGFFSLPTADTPTGQQMETSDDEPLFAFSQSGTNVVYLLLDSLTSVRLPAILATHPEWREAFDGFTWHRNTMSVGSFTFPNVPAILGGLDYTPHRVNEAGMMLKVAYNSAWTNYVASVLKGQYRMAATRRYLGYGLEEPQGVVYFSESDTRWNHTQRHGHAITTGVANGNLRILRCNALLWSIPRSIRNWLYDGGRWHSSDDNTTASVEFNFLRSLSSVSQVSKEQKGLYVHIHSDSTHYPYLTPREGQLVHAGIDACFEWALERVLEWFAWMKKNNVYDNTRIVLCADHGCHVPPGGFSDWELVNERSAEQAVRMSPALFLPILLTKEAGERHPLKTSSGFKTVAHAAYFALGKTEFRKNVDSLVCTEIRNTEGWGDVILKAKGYDAVYEFRVTGNPSDGANWMALPK